MSKQVGVDKFVAKLGVSGKYEKDGRKKYHIIVPRQYIDQIESLDLKENRLKYNGK